MAVSKQLRVPTDPEFLKPVIEALIFASEEPISARALIRLFAGERDGDREENVPEESPVPDVETAAESVGEGDVDTEPVGEQEVETAVESVETQEDISGEEAAAEETTPSDDPSPAAGDAGVGGAADTVQDLVGAMGAVELRFAGYPTRPGSVDQAYLRALIDELNGEYQESGRAFRIIEVAGGFQFATVRDYGEWVALLSKEKSRRRLSPAALETLAIIAYRQPASKPEIESIRGVNCDQVLVNLMEKNLITISGRSEAVGRPLLYSTTDDFLRSFGLKGIGDLPKLREIEELMEEDAFSPDRVEVITVDENTDAEEIEARVGAAGHHSSAGNEDGTVVEPSAMEDLFSGEHHPIELVEDDAIDEEPGAAAGGTDEGDELDAEDPFGSDGIEGADAFDASDELDRESGLEGEAESDEMDAADSAGEEPSPADDEPSPEETGDHESMGDDGGGAEIVEHR